MWRVAKAVLIGAVPPLMLKTAANPGGLPMESGSMKRVASAVGESSAAVQLVHKVLAE